MYMPAAQLRGYTPLIALLIAMREEEETMESEHGTVSTDCCSMSESIMELVSSELHM